MVDKNRQCPDLLYYSYHYQGGATACSTNEFYVRDAKMFMLDVMFENNTGEALRLGKPSLWTNEALGDYTTFLPDFKYSIPTGDVSPGEKFMIKFKCDTGDVPDSHQFITIRPQLERGGWYHPLEKATPISKYNFQCDGGTLETSFRILKLVPGRIDV